MGASDAGEYMCGGMTAVDGRQAEEVDQFGPNDDDEEIGGYRRLYKPHVPYEEFGIAEFNWDAEMALGAVCEARRVFERSGAGKRARRGLTNRREWDSRWLHIERGEHENKLLPFLNKLVTRSMPLLPRPGLILDIVPAIRTMVAADNVLAEDKSWAVRRRTVREGARESARAAVSAMASAIKYERYISLGAAELVAVQETSYVTRAEDVGCNVASN